MTARLTCFVLVAALGIACQQPTAQRGTAGPEGEVPAASRFAGGSPSAAEPALAERESLPAPAAAPSSSRAEAAPLQFTEVTVPAGTTLSLKLASAVGSDSSNVEDPVRATLASPIVIRGVAAVPAGATVTGRVTAAQRSGRVKGRASIGLRFDRLSAWNETHDISTARVSRRAPATKAKDAQKIGIGAGAGALVGAVSGGKKGAAIGGAVGAGAGTGVVVATRGKEVRLSPGAVVRTTLQKPLTVRIPVE